MSISLWFVIGITAIISLFVTFSAAILMTCWWTHKERTYVKLISSVSKATIAVLKVKKEEY